MQREQDFLRAELDKRDLELSEAKERLRKREDELRDLKESLNAQLGLVESEYRNQLIELNSRLSILEEESRSAKQVAADERKLRD